MINSKQERAARRLIILEGLKGGLSKEKIAKKLGVNPRIVRKDLNRMKYSKDPDLRQTQINVKEKADANKERISNRPGERFLRITGMTFQEKTFNNMMSFYEPEIRKILRVKEQDVAIRDLPGSVVKTLKRNGIIASGWKTLQVTQKARNYLVKSRLVES